MSIAGSVHPLPMALALMALGWMLRSGVDISWHYRIRATDLVREDGKSGDHLLLSAACDVVDLLAQSPEGRQALRDLGLEPVLQHVEGERNAGL